MPEVMIENGIIKCRNASGHFMVCDPLGLYSANQHCGNCPLILLAEKCIKIMWNIE